MRVLVDGENGVEAWEIQSLSYDNKLFRITDIINNQTSFKPFGLVMVTTNGLYGIRYVDKKNCEEVIQRIAREGYANLSIYTRYEKLCGQKELDEAFDHLSDDNKQRIREIINS